jgi:spermidine synthase
MKIYHEDARTFLNHSENKYDVIYDDAYKSLYTIPWHLATLEVAKKTYEMLNDRGCVLMNIISSLEGNASLFLQAELATYRKVFPDVYVFAVMDPSDSRGVQSIMMVAVKSGVKPEMKNIDSVLNEYLQHEATAMIKANRPVLTDEFAPVDYYTNKAIE